MVPLQEESIIEAEVEKIFFDYVLCTTQDGIKITFSLCATVWEHAESRPQVGECLELSDLRKFAKGWRAMQARRLKFPKTETAE